MPPKVKSIDDRLVGSKRPRSSVSGDSVSASAVASTSSVSVDSSSAVESTSSVSSEFESVVSSSVSSASESIVESTSFGNASLVRPLDVLLDDALIPGHAAVAVSSMSYYQRKQQKKAMQLENQILREQQRTIRVQKVLSVLREYCNGIFIAMKAKSMYKGRIFIYDLATLPRGALYNCGYTSKGKFSYVSAITFSNQPVIPGHDIIMISCGSFEDDGVIHLWHMPRTLYDSTSTLSTASASSSSTSTTLYRPTSSASASSASPSTSPHSCIDMIPFKTLFFSNCCESWPRQARLLPSGALLVSNELVATSHLSLRDENHITTYAIFSSPFVKTTTYQLIPLSVALDSSIDNKVTISDDLPSIIVGAMLDCGGNDMIQLVTSCDDISIADVATTYTHQCADSCLSQASSVLLSTCATYVAAGYQALDTPDIQTVAGSDVLQLWSIKHNSNDNSINTYSFELLKTVSIPYDPAAPAAPGYTNDAARCVEVLAFSPNSSVLLAAVTTPYRSRQVNGLIYCYSVPDMDLTMTLDISGRSHDEDINVLQFRSFEALTFVSDDVFLVSRTAKFRESNGFETSLCLCHINHRYPLTHFPNMDISLIAKLPDVKLGYVLK